MIRSRSSLIGTGSDILQEEMTPTSVPIKDLGPVPRTSQYRRHLRDSVMVVAGACGLYGVLTGAVTVFLGLLLLACVILLVSIHAR